VIYILLNILASVVLLVIFKLFDKFKVNSLHAIIVNYITASVTGLLFSKHSFDLETLYHSKWIFVSIPLGFLLISIFNLISLTTQKISISTASVANKMSVAMPVLFSVLVLNVELTMIKVAGIVLALAALYFATRSNDENKHIDKKLIWLPLLVFLGSGLIDTAINATNAFYIKNEQDSEMFTITSFFCAFVIGIFVLIYTFYKHTSQKKETAFFEPKSILAGIILGIPNYFSIFFIIKALESNVLNSAQLFPVLNISNVVLSALIGVLIFKENLSTQNKIGLALAVVAIFLITL